MTYEQYWEMDCQMVKYYREAYELRREVANQDAWIQGMYIYEALVDVAPYLRAFGAKKPVPYRKEPYELYAKKGKGKALSREDACDQKAKALMETFMVQFNKRFEKGGDKNAG